MSISCVFLEKLISASGLGLADSVNIWLLCNPEVQAHHLALPPPYPMSDHFLCSMPQDYWLIHTFMPGLTLFPLPPCIFSVQIRSVSLLDEASPDSPGRVYCFPHASLPRFLCRSCAHCVTLPAEMSVSIPVLSAPLGKVGLQPSS